MTTTGACTKPAYSDSGDGRRAASHHTLGAIFVRKVGDLYFHWEIIWNGKGFYLLDQYWTPEGMTRGHTAAGLVRGDDHAIKRYEPVIQARKRLCELVKPDKHVFHDVLDGESVNHHHTLLDRVEVHEAGNQRLSDELDKTAKLVDETGGRDNWIVDSNHDRWIERYADKGMHLKEPWNTACVSELLARRIKEKKSCLEIAFSDRIPGRYKFLNPNEPALISGVDCSQHFDRGPGGSRRVSTTTLAKTSRPMIGGHKHSPERYRNVVVVGVSQPSSEHPYASGLSAWACADGLIYDDGTVHLIYYIKGKSLADYI